MTETDGARLAIAREFADRLHPIWFANAGWEYLRRHIVDYVLAALASRDAEIERLRASETSWIRRAATALTTMARVQEKDRTERDNAIREGRRQMREEAAQVAQRHWKDQRRWMAVTDIEEIRALPDDPPTQEPDQSA